MQRLTEEQRLAMMDEYRDGVPMKEIAARYGVSVSYPSQVAGRLGVQRRVPAAGRRRMSEAAYNRPKLADAIADDIAAPVALDVSTDNSVYEIRRLAALGRKRTEIAALLRCSYREVEAALT